MPSSRPWFVLALLSLAVVALTAALPEHGRFLVPREVQETTDPGGDSPRTGQRVTVVGVVVATSPHGNFWYLADPAGGPWSGLKVEGPSLDREPGEHVFVTGEVREEFGETRLVARSVRARGTAPLPSPTTVTAADLADGTGEPWEGTLVRVEDVTVERAPNDFGEWDFADATAGGAEVDDEFWVSYYADPGDRFASLTGLVAWGFGDFRMEPRFDADLEGWLPGREFDGLLEVAVTDQEARPLPAKVTLIPIGGPSIVLGPRDRAEGAEDVAFLPPGGGEVRLPSGTYDVLVSRGPEYRVRTERVSVPSGGIVSVAVVLPREVDTAGWISGDFHLHCAPSSDTSLPVPGRLLSLAAEGVEWAVATDHNMVTDYSALIESMGLAEWMRSSVGDEITTRSPSWGHFNAWPLVPGTAPLPYASLDPEALFAAARGGVEDEIVQVNHPSIPAWGNQYFDVYEVDPHTGEPGVPGFSWNFDAIEVFNGSHVDQGLATFETWMRLLNRGRFVTATGNSDSHHLVFAEPGYPRNYVRCDSPGPEAADEHALVEAVREGAVTVSYGPFVTFEANGAGPGSLAGAPGGAVDVAIRVQCPSWLSVSEVRLYANGRVIATFPVTTAPRGKGAARGGAATGTGPQDVHFAFTDHPERDSWYLAFAEGGGNLEPVRRGIGFRPLAFTNPVRVDVDGDGLFTPPGDVADLATIEEIDEVDAAGVPVLEGRWVAVRGCATTDTGFLDPTAGLFYVDDGTGGVQVREGLGMPTAVQRGDALWVGGTVAQLAGETVLLGATVLPDSTAPPCPEPEDIATGDVGGAMEPREGRVIRVRNVRVTEGTWPSGGAEGAVTLDDDSGPALLVVPQGVVVPAEASGLDRFDVTAILAQRDLAPPYDAGYHLLLRSGADLPVGGVLAVALGEFRAGFGTPAPNPFRASLRIPYAGLAGDRLRLDIHDVRGALVRRIEVEPQGEGEVVWDGRDAGGRSVAPGVYWIRLPEGAVTRTVKVVKLRGR